MTLETRGLCGSGKCEAEISLRRLSVRGCVVADRGTKARLCSWTLVYGEPFGGAGISADLTETGAFFRRALQVRRISVPCAQRNTALDKVENAPYGAMAPEGAVLGS